MGGGGDRFREFWALGRAGRSQSAKKLRQAVAQESFPAGEPDFFYAGVHKDSHQTQVVGKRKFRILSAFVSGAAIDAFVITAVRDADAEVGDKAPVFVLKPHMLRR